MPLTEPQHLASCLRSLVLPGQKTVELGTSIWTKSSMALASGIGEVQEVRRNKLPIILW